MSSLYWLFFFKQNGFKFWAKFLERFGTPILLGKVKEGDDEDKKDEDIMYGKDIISKRLKDKQLPYIVMDCSVKTLVTEKGQDSRPSRTLWILKKIEFCKIMT